VYGAADRGEAMRWKMVVEGRDNISTICLCTKINIAISYIMLYSDTYG